MHRTGGSACPGKGGSPAVSLLGPGRVSAEGLSAGLRAGPRSRATAGIGEGAGRDLEPRKAFEGGEIKEALGQIDLQHEAKSEGQKAPLCQP